jgi:hypothetical protein
MRFGAVACFALVRRLLVEFAVLHAEAVSPSSQIEKPEQINETFFARDVRPLVRRLHDGERPFVRCRSRRAPEKRQFTNKDQLPHK